MLAPYNGFRYGVPNDLGPGDCNKLVLVLSAPTTSDPLGILDAQATDIHIWYEIDGGVRWDCTFTWTHPAHDPNWFATNATVQASTSTEIHPPGGMARSGNSALTAEPGGRSVTRSADGVCPAQAMRPT